MVYQWKIQGLHKLDAQTAGEELKRISDKHGLTTEAVVNESRQQNAVLHNIFDWNDATAAESYRKAQAGELIRNIVTVKMESEKPLAQPVRAFVSIKESYQPIDIVIKTESYKNEMLHTALKELNSFRQKYSALIELTSLLENIKTAINELDFNNHDE